MNEDGNMLFASFFIGAFVGMLTLMIILAIATEDYDHNNRTIVSHSCAKYNSTTGDFEWLDTIKVKEYIK